MIIALSLDILEPTDLKLLFIFMLKQYYLKNSTSKIIISFLAALFFIYILLFEFILPANKVLPKPSILYFSISDLFTDYNFLPAFIFTVSVIYISIFLSYILVKLFAPLLIKIGFAFPKLNAIFLLNKYFMPVFLVFLFSFWFQNNIYAEYFFSMIIIGTALKETLLKENLKVKTEYVKAAKSLGVKDSLLIKTVIWKTLQPRLYKTLVKYNFILWCLILVYEYITRTGGLGNIFRLAIKYNDISIIVLLILIVMFTIYLFSILIKSIEKKFFFWEA